ncbi:GH25 family lysozyme [Enterococcus faecalis]|uniref:GH25 family lysozyme n=1 Tax=Enterococcus faecalis TaxID=1351 RepID=UPI003BB957A1
MKRINKISVITMLMLTTLVPSSSIVYAIDASSSESAEEVISADTAETLNSTSSSEETSTESSSSTLSSVPSETKNSLDTRGATDTRQSTDTEETSETTSSSEANKKDEDEIVITEDMNKPMGSGMKGTRRKRAAYAYGDPISITEANRPPKNFIDVSSWNGSLSVANYQTMKSYGIGGVVVKMTEATTYQNPERFAQVQNANAVGIKVSAYHYSHFTTKDQAIKEANYFADTAINTGLPKDTLMINDAEEGSMNNGQLTANSIAFANQLKARGFTNVLHYSMAAWFTEGVLSPTQLGTENIWIAQYPFEPTADQLWHKNEGYAAWQWSSLLTIPGVDIGVGVFDINADYTGRFTSSGGKQYDVILDEKQYDYTARVKPAAESGKHGVFNGIMNTAPGIVNIGMGDKYANQRIGLGSLYANQNVQIIQSAKLSTGVTVYQFQINGQTIGWLDSRAFSNVYDELLDEKRYDYMAKVKPAAESGKHGVFNGIMNTAPGIVNIGMGDKYANQSVHIIGYAKTSRTELLHFTVGGKDAGWMDKRAFTATLDKATYSKMSRGAKIGDVAVSSKHGLYTKPNNTAEDGEKIGLGSLYANQNVQIIQSAKLSTGVTAYQFQINGRTIGWLDSRAFKM